MSSQSYDYRQEILGAAISRSPMLCTVWGSQDTAHREKRSHFFVTTSSQAGENKDALSQIPKFSVSDLILRILEIFHLQICTDDWNRCPNVSKDQLKRDNLKALEAFRSRSACTVMLLCWTCRVFTAISRPHVKGCT